MVNVAGVIIILIGLGVLVAGGCVFLKPQESVEYWIAERLNTNFLGIEIEAEKTHEGQVIPKIGSLTLSVHQDLGLWNIKKADSMIDATSLARKEGLVTGLAGIVILAVGGKVS